MRSGYADGSASSLVMFRISLNLQRLIKPVAGTGKQCKSFNISSLRVKKADHECKIMLHNYTGDMVIADPIDLIKTNSLLY